MMLKDPEAFARLLLLPADIIQNAILQLANNNKQALVGTLILDQRIILESEKFGLEICQMILQRRV